MPSKAKAQKRTQRREFKTYESPSSSEGELKHRIQNVPSDFTKDHISMMRGKGLTFPNSFTVKAFAFGTMLFNVAACLYMYEISYLMS